jgi:hypothetical protein
LHKYEQSEGTIGRVAFVTIPIRQLTRFEVAQPALLFALQSEILMRHTAFFAWSNMKRHIAHVSKMRFNTQKNCAKRSVSGFLDKKVSAPTMPSDFIEYNRARGISQL